MPRRSVRGRLDVWLYGTHLGTLSEPNYDRIRFEPRPEAEERWGVGSAVLSVGLPLDTTLRPTGDKVRSFFRGLLPEGHAGDRIAESLGLATNDAYGLLMALGRDCAGAVMIVPEGEPAVTRDAGLQPLEDGELERLLGALDEHPLGVDDEFRASLPGVQEKLLLARTADGRWARPLGGAPSTHILKPQDLRLDAYAAGEAFALLLARQVGLTSVDAEVIEVAGRPVLVTSRYDRIPGPSGPERLHQEDACQALSVDTWRGQRRKYQTDGGPSLRQVADVLLRYASARDREQLLAISTLNVVMGNADAHGKNISFLHAPDGTVGLAPAYDVTPVTFYREVPTDRGPRPYSSKLGMFINGVDDIHAVTADDLAEEARRWGMPPARGKEVVQSTLLRLGDAIGPALELVSLPEPMQAFVIDRIEALLAGRRAGGWDFLDIQSRGASLPSVRWSRRAGSEREPCNASLDGGEICRHPIGPLRRCPVHGSRPVPRPEL